MTRNYLRRPLLVLLLLASLFIHFYHLSYYSNTSPAFDVAREGSNGVTREERKDTILEETDTQPVLPVAELITEVKAMDQRPLSSTEMKKIFFEEGVVGPFHLLSQSERDAFLAKGRKSALSCYKSHNSKNNTQCEHTNNYGAYPTSF